MPKKQKPPARTDVVQRARLAGLLLETLLSKAQGDIPANARSKIAEAAKLLADASRMMGRAVAGARNLPVLKVKRRVKSKARR